MAIPRCKRECPFLVKDGICSNNECYFRHLCPHKLDCPNITECCNIHFPLSRIESNDFKTICFNGTKCKYLIKGFCMNQHNPLEIHFAEKARNEISKKSYIGNMDQYYKDMSKHIKNNIDKHMKKQIAFYKAQIEKKFCEVYFHINNVKYEGSFDNIYQQYFDIYLKLLKDKKTINYIPICEDYDIEDCECECDYDELLKEINNKDANSISLPNSACSSAISRSSVIFNSFRCSMYNFIT